MDFKKKQIKTSVVACIIDAQERILLTRRCIEPFCGAWVMPGGKIDHGELIMAALHREVAEEVGLEIQVEGLIDVFEHVRIGEDEHHYVILYYRCAPLSLELHPNGDECAEAIWAEKERLPKMCLPPGSRHILAKVYPELAWGETPQNEDADRELPGGISAQPPHWSAED